MMTLLLDFALADPGVQLLPTLDGRFGVQRVHVDDVDAAFAWKDRSGDNRLLVDIEEDWQEERDGPETFQVVQVRVTASHLGARATAELAPCQVAFDTGSSWMPLRAVTYRVWFDSDLLTDLDEDGIAEATFAVELGCTKPGEPTSMEVFVMEGDRSWSLGGPTTGITQIAFDGAPPALLAHARREWADFVLREHRPKGSLVRAAEGSVDLVRGLLQSGADPNETDASGYGAVFAAARAHQADIIDLLVEAGASVQAHKEWSPMHSAARGEGEGGGKTVDRLVAHGVPVDPKNKHGETPLQLAITSHDKVPMDLVERLLVHGADPGLSLHLAADRFQSDAVDLVRLLLDHGADPLVRDPEGKSLVQSAANSKVAAYLKERGATDPGEDMMEAIHARDGAALSRALARGADPNEVYPPWNTLALASAARLEDAAAIELLLARGADPNARDHKGAPLLLAAVDNGGCSEAITRRLLAAGAQPDLTDAFGRTALHWAAARCGPETVKLLATPASLQTRDKHQRTVLHYACSGQLWEVSGPVTTETVVFLLKRGVDPSLTDKDGQTAMQRCSEGGESEAVLELLRAGR